MPWICRTCRKTFSSKAYLEAHKKGQTTEKVYMCDIYGKLLWMKFFLPGHNKFHTGERPYVCTKCGKMYFRKPHQNIHKKVHHIANSQWNRCEKFFGCNSYLMNLRFQTEARPYMLSKFGNTFSSFTHFTFLMEYHIGQRFFLSVTVIVSLLFPLLSSFPNRNTVTLEKQLKRTCNIVSHELQMRMLTRLAFLLKAWSTLQTLHIWTLTLWRLATSFRCVRQFMMTFNRPKVLIWVIYFHFSCIHYSPSISR